MKKQELISKLELKNLKFHKGHDYFDGFSAILIMDGKKVANVYDDSYGGGYQYDQIGEGKELNEIHALCKQLPKEKSEWCEEHEEGMEVQLDFLLDDLLNKAKAKKDEKKGILIKSNNGWEIQGWNVSIPTMLKKYSATSIIKSLQEDYDKLIKDGANILNESYLQSIGLIINNK